MSGHVDVRCSHCQKTKVALSENRRSLLVLRLCIADLLVCAGIHPAGAHSLGHSGVISGADVGAMGRSRRHL
jgi:hypothetical protein